ncbi:MAG: hypothetical protein EU544_04205 [Promethearchaeota archaeon]|nr:MAG: hypothetical protein EU544_04205 [Candidatus Lokiarchaeota archaeon]
MVEGPKFFNVDDYITLRLEEGKTVIYVGGKRFRQCARLMLTIPKVDLGEFEEIKSIDEAAELYQTLYENKILETDDEDHSISPEQEFWGHSSNLHAWVENDYDTRLIHSNLALPLLKELNEIGAKRAKQRFREEVLNRYRYGNESTQSYIERAFMTGIGGPLFSTAEIISGTLSTEESLIMEEFERKSRFKYKLYSYRYGGMREHYFFNKLFFRVKRGYLRCLEVLLDAHTIPLLPKLTTFKHLEHLFLYLDENIPNLEELNLSSIETLSIYCTNGNIWDYQHIDDSICLDLENITNLFPNLHTLNIFGVPQDELLSISITVTKVASIIQQDSLKKVSLEWITVSKEQENILKQFKGELILEKFSHEKFMEYLSAVEYDKYNGRPNNMRKVPLDLIKYYTKKKNLFEQTPQKLINIISALIEEFRRKIVIIDPHKVKIVDIIDLEIPKNRIEIEKMEMYFKEGYNYTPQEEKAEISEEICLWKNKNTYPARYIDIKEDGNYQLVYLHHPPIDRRPWDFFNKKIGHSFKKRVGIDSSVNYDPY